MTRLGPRPRRDQVPVQFETVRPPSPRPSDPEGGADTGGRADDTAGRVFITQRAGVEAAAAVGGAAGGGREGPWCADPLPASSADFSRPQMLGGGQQRRGKAGAGSSGAAGGALPAIRTGAARSVKARAAGGDVWKGSGGAAEEAADNQPGGGTQPRRPQPHGPAQRRHRPVAARASGGSSAAPAAGSPARSTAAAAVTRSAPSYRELRHQLWELRGRLSTSGSRQHLSGGGAAAAAAAAQAGLWCRRDCDEAALLSGWTPPASAGAGKPRSGASGGGTGAGAPAAAALPPVALFGASRRLRDALAPAAGARDSAATQLPSPQVSEPPRSGACRRARQRHARQRMLQGSSAPMPWGDRARPASTTRPPGVPTNERARCRAARPCNVHLTPNGLPVCNPMGAAASHPRERALRRAPD